MYRATSRPRTVPEPRQVNLFAWTVFLLLLTGLAIASWIGSFQVFGHPEHPVSHRILTALGKLTPPQRFELTRAPQGEFLTPRAFLERYLALPTVRLLEASERLQRSYIRNYSLQKDRVPYLVGRFVILDARQFGEADYFPSGVVALARSIDQPALLIEYVCPAEPDTVGVLADTLQVGMELKFERSIDLCVAIAVSRPAEGRLLATVVPLLYGSYARPDGEGHFSLAPPKILRPAAGLPITHKEQIGEAETRYAELQRTWNRTEAAGVLARVMRATPANPSHRAELPAARPTDSAKPAPPTPAPVDESEVAEENTTPVRPATAASSPRTPSSSPLPTVSTVAGSSSPPILKPFFASDHASVSPSPTPPASASPHAGTWRLYEPGGMPRGRLVGVREAAGLGRTVRQGERYYLDGAFTVEKSGSQLATLRPRRSLAARVPGLGRVIDGRVWVEVEFPPGQAPPPAGTTIVRDSARPFQILAVEPNANGETVIRAREVTTP